MKNPPQDRVRGRPTYRRLVLFSSVIVVLTVVIAIVFGELLLTFREQSGRPSPLAEAARRRREQVPEIYEMSPAGLRLKRFLDQKFTDPISGREVGFRTNNLGYRGDAVGAKPAGEIRILALGDSITLGSYVEENETYPAILQGLLRGADAVPTLPAVRVVNAGISGAALREELHVLNETGLLIQPDIVLVGLFLNDALRSRMFPLPEGLMQYSAIARQLSLARLADQMQDEARVEYERLSGKPYPGQTYAIDAWRTDRTAFEAEVAREANDWGRAWYPEAWEIMKPDLEVMRGLAAAHGFDLAVVLFPATIQVEAAFIEDGPQRHFESLMTELRVPHLDLLPVLRAAYADAGHSLAYDHCHLTPEGNAATAKAVAAFLRPILANRQSANRR